MLDTLQPKGIVQYEHVRGDLILRRGIVHNDVTIVGQDVCTRPLLRHEQRRQLNLVHRARGQHRVHRIQPH